MNNNHDSSSLSSGAVSGTAASGGLVKNVVLLGKGELAIRAAGWFNDHDGHHLAAVVPVVPEPTWTTSLVDWCSANDVPQVTSGDYRELVDVLGSTEIDLAVSIFYDKIIRPDFIDSCGRIINLHNGPLPRYRGVSPINWALKNGEEEHGVTLHEIAPGIDDGDIVSQARFSIFPEIDEVVDVLHRATDYGWQLFLSTVPMLDRIIARPQDHDQALTYYRSQDQELGDRRSFTRQQSRTDAEPTAAA